jgi:cytochrome oxidase Cu insertion factor (SCO1/SenC/PrrC family)
MFILEKDIPLPSVTIDAFGGENRKTPYLALNPALNPAEQTGCYTLDHTANIFLFDCTGRFRQKVPSGQSAPTTSRLIRKIQVKS